MYFTLEQLDGVVSSTLIQKLKNKNTGGPAARDGFRFEVSYAAYVLINLAARCKQDDLDSASTYVGGQLLSFVDDFVTYVDGILNWYEMKSGAEVRWETGKRPVLPNFVRQAALDRHFQVDASYHLVIADSASFASLKNPMPKAPEIGLIHFPEEPSPFPVEERFEGFIGAIASLLGGTWAEALNDMGILPDWFINDDRNEVVSTYRAFRAAFETLSSSEIYSMTQVFDIVAGVTFGAVSLNDYHLTDEALAVLHNVDDVKEVIEAQSRVKLLFKDRVVVDIPVVLGSSAGDHFDSLLQVRRPDTFSDVMRLAFQSRTIKWRPQNSTVEFLSMFGE
ncbi:hypothetical protein QBK93_30925 [Rhizobium leguminosarum]|uniref:hypothetical protein n=1 Tax=Rhizobium leguminosarum TaxID=384 RepID=UPI0024A87A76|nr:hypothetical protein [Rhizobium leguminosarum]MDI5929059.1 hypothetical protein [Rhizobium leguminosarum]